MLTVAYLANEYPCAVEPYVAEEIAELRDRGVRVIECSVRQSAADKTAEIVLQEMNLGAMVTAVWLLLTRWRLVLPLVRRVLLDGREGYGQRVKALLHTLLGAIYAVRLRSRGVDHIHVHHGYFGSWIAMAASLLLDIPFSMTLHGSDLLLNPNYLDVKLAHCCTCFTVSEYNRRYILERYPSIDQAKIVVARLGVDVSESVALQKRSAAGRFTMVAVGRLHAVKNHAFLVRSCGWLKDAGIDFDCLIAGEGPERHDLERLIRDLRLERQVTLLGHVPRKQTASLYDRADVVVLTSRSEGIPLVLMEAMARGRIVLAPAITGLPELVIPEKTGFLYEPGSMRDFVDRLISIFSLMQRESSEAEGTSRSSSLDWVRYGAHVQVMRNFHRETNLDCFVNQLLGRMPLPAENLPDENLVLQQI